MAQFAAYSRFSLNFRNKIPELSQKLQLFLGNCCMMLCISAAYAVVQCPSDCPSRLWTLLKRINVSAKFFHHRVATPF